MHTCNPFCAGGLHAVLFTMKAGDYGAVDWQQQNAIAEGVCTALGLKFESASNVPNPVLQGAAPSTGPHIGRVVAWAKST
jgi:hypothetical protein